jgi:hypothetical protein
VVEFNEQYLLGRFGFKPFNTVFGIPQIGTRFMSEGLNAVKTLRQLASHVHNLLEGLFPDWLCVVSPRFKFLKSRIQFSDTRIRRIKASKNPFLERAAVRAGHILCRFFGHRRS